MRHLHSSSLRKLAGSFLLTFLAVASMAWADSLTFSEKYQEKAIKVKEGKEISYDVVPEGNFNVTISISLKDQDLDITQIDESSPVTISVGDFSFEGMLSDDPDYKAGDKSAVIIQRGDSEDDDLGPKVLKVSLKWTASVLKVKITGVTPDFITGIDAVNSLGEDAGSVATDFQASVQFDAALQNFDCTGKAKVSYQNFGKKDDVVTVGTVKLKGSGEVPAIEE